MEEVRQLVQEEGREARNLVAFHVSVDTPAARVSRKPPRSVVPPARRAPPRNPAGARLRSASAGRDKRSELRARYWALLFGDLQRAIGEIYNTVETHENLSECQEVILVLENYTRDFKALGEWFRLKWEYDNTPPPQRPQSLAWEIRKTDFVRPESRRAYSVKSSPSVSGKNSPSLSGHNTPSGKNSPVTGKASPGSGKISPRISHVTSPKGNIEFFSNKINSKITAKPEPKVGKETRLSDIKEKDKEFTDVKDVGEVEDLKKPVVEVGKAKECFNVSPKPVVVKSKSPQPRPKEISEQAKATTRQLDAMENEFLEKQLMENKVKNDNMVNQDIESEKSVEVDKDKDGEVERKDSTSTESPTKSDDNFADVSNESTSPNNSKESSSPTDISEDKTTESDNNEKLTDVTEECVEVTPEKASEDIASQENIEGSVEKTELKDLDNNKSTDTNKEVIDKEDTKKQKESDKEDLKKDKPVEQKNTRPAYSQAAAKPKLVTSKSDNKIATRPVTTVARSKNVVEAPNVVPKTRQFPKRNQTSKCSYPFNLTTGRTSLFDAPPATTKPVAKKPIRNIQIGSGDSKTVNKIDVKKHPTRPTTLKINEKGDKKEKNNPSLENIKDCDEYSSSETIVTQIDMSRIESSESLKTLVPEELQMIQDVANSIEVLNVDNNKSDNEGWLTVKSRRLSRESKKQSKSHWANRFHQPSATTSLPTLNMISPKQESNPILNKPPIKVDRAKSEQPEKRKAEKVKVTLKPKSASKAKDPAMIRQKSDVTGLKTHSARNKIGRKSEKVKDSPEKEGELTKNRLHSSLESLTMGLARSQESTEPVFDFDKWKAEFTSTFKYLDEDDQIPNHNEILKSADPSEMSEIAEMTSQIEENERKMCLALDFQTDVDQRKLCEEEDLLNRQIMELQQVSDIDLDTETDDTETDAEILCPSHTPPPGELGALAASLEDQYETALAGMTWAERVDTLVVLEALVARDPGRAQQLHAKLSQGIKRRGSFQDALRRLQAKQARAERQRLEYQTERAKKIHQLLGRVEEVKAAKNQLTEEKRLRMERRLQRAAENRDQHLKDIVRKAHDEEEKLREIAFIKQLEAENRRHEFMDQCRAHTSRLRHMRRDRLCKLEQKAAREAAVGARRQALEAARKLHVETLLEKRKERDARVEEMKGIKKQERDDAAREKAEGVKSRLSALAAAAELEADALRSRIRDKQDASQMRLESHLQAIREKATGPRQPTTSESQDQISKEEKELQEETERAEQERREREKQKAVKKKARKVKQKLLATSNDTTFTNQQINEVTYIEPSTTKLLKVINQLKNLLAPLLDSENNENGKIEDEEDRNRKNKKITNGFENEGAEKKKKKKRASEERHVIENKENGDDKEESIPDDKKKKNLEKVERKNSKEIQEEKESRKKKKRNKEVDKERPRLIKTSSVCSSLSETSKVVVSERASALERQLNELCRVLDKAIESPPWPPLRPALAALGQVLEAATHHTLSHRCLTTAANMLWTLLSGSSAVGAYLLTHSAAVHLTRLLSVLLERELLDARECELVSRLCACAGAVLSGAHDRARAHTLVSYLCLSGCFAREHCESVRPSVLALLATCAELCQPSDTDTGPERASALQSLRCALGPSLCHARGELCAQFDHAPHVAATAHMLRATATLDHKLVQEAFGSGGWALELRAAVARLLALHAPGDRDPPRTAHGTASEKEQNMSEALVIDLIVLVGFVVVNNPQLQETICSGWSVIKTLCTLPAAWLVCPRRSRALLPTLAAMGTSARAVIAHDLNTQILDEYLDSPEAQNVKLVQVIKQGRAKKAAAKK